MTINPNNILKSDLYYNFLLPEFPSTLQEILKFTLERYDLDTNNFHFIMFYESYIYLDDFEVIETKVVINMKKVICLNHIYEINFSLFQPSILIYVLYYDIFCKISKHICDAVNNLDY